MQYLVTKSVLHTIGLQSRIEVWRLVAQEFVENTLQIIGCTADLKDFFPPAATSLRIDWVRLEGCIVSATRSEDDYMLFDIGCTHASIAYTLDQRYE